MVKVSIILPTHRSNDSLMVKIKNLQNGLKISPDDMFNTEFKSLLRRKIYGVNHYLEPTLNSLANQTFKDFELIVSHKHADIVDKSIFDKYSFPIKLVQEKPSIWHEIGDKYPTLCNNINTAVIHSEGELLWRLDDLTFFNDKVVSELYTNWINGKYSTSRTFRCIDYNPQFVDELDNSNPRKINVCKGGWKAQYKQLTSNTDNSIPKAMAWGCSSTVSLEDFLKVNGQDELWDGSINGTDMEFGERLARASNIPRVATNNMVYEINDVPYKYMTRIDTTFRTITRYPGIKANCWKPSKVQMKRYARWHIKFHGDLDPNWNRMLDVPYIDMTKEYKSKKLGKVVFDNSQ